MNMLLTSAGVANPTIHRALEELLPRPINECSALAITTASYAHPYAGPGRAWNFITGINDLNMTNLGWKSIGVLELTALPSLSRDVWVPWIEQADVLLVNGGETMYLAHWIRGSDLLDLLPDWPGVWVGLSAGSMVMSKRIGKQFVHWPEPRSDDAALGLVEFAFFPHTNHPDMPDFTLADAERWAEGIDGPAWAADDESAFVVVNGEMRPVTEGLCVKLHD